MSSVGDLVAYLTVNTVGFQQGFAKAQSIAKTGTASIVTSSIAPLTAALAGAFGAGSAIAAAKEDLRAMQKLEAVLKATGGAAGLSAKEIAEYATQLQKATNFGDETTVGAAAMVATFKNVRGESFKEVLSLAQDWAALTETDLAGAAHAFGKALNDPMAGLARLAKMGIQFSDAQKQQIKTMQEAGNVAGAQKVILDQLQSSFGGTAAALADPWTQLKNAIGDVGEQIGGLLLPAVNALSEGLMDVVHQGQDVFASLRETVQEWTDGTVIAFSTLGESAYLFYLQAQLAVVQTAAEFSHFFTQTIPGYLDWFGENWQDVIFTAADYAATAFINVGHNIREAWQAAIDFISGNPVNPDFKKITEGAVNAIKALPNIPDRIKGELEKGLMDNIKEQERVIDRKQKEIADDLVQKRIDREKAKGFEPRVPEDAEKKTTKDLKFGALQKGSVEAVSSVLQAMRSGQGGVQEKQLKAEEDQVELAQRQLEETRRLGEQGIVLFGGSFA